MNFANLEPTVLDKIVSLLVEVEEMKEFGHSLVFAKILIMTHHIIIVYYFPMNQE